MSTLDVKIIVIEIINSIGYTRKRTDKPQFKGKIGPAVLELNLSWDTIKLIWLHIV